MSKSPGPNRVVITGLDPVIHVFLFCGDEDVDGRVKPGHDAGESSNDAQLPPRDAIAPGLMPNLAASGQEGVGNAGREAHPQPCVQMKKARKQVTTSPPGHPGIPARGWV